jgi:threonine dehydrogenase-like Zn-dependent dehydrogenase
VAIVTASHCSRSARQEGNTRAIVFTACPAGWSRDRRLPPAARRFPIGKATNENLTIKMGNCNHRKCIPQLLERVRTGAIDPSEVLTQEEPVEAILEGYLDRREPG